MKNFQKILEKIKNSAIMMLCCWKTAYNITREYEKGVAGVAFLGYGYDTVSTIFVKIRFVMKWQDFSVAFTGKVCLFLFLKCNCSFSKKKEGERKMEVLLQLLLIAIGFLMLVKGADWFVDGSSGIARKFGIPQLIIGLTIVAMGTSAPEAAVSISAALKGNADITVGNIVGSNILNVLIILGISSVIVPLAVSKSTIRVDIPVVFLASVLLLVLGWNGNLNWIAGLALLVVFILYMAYLFIEAMKHKEESSEDTENLSVWKAIIFTIIGLILIVWGSNVTVDAATTLATLWGMSPRFIGLTIVALGTSLPELFTSVVAARKGNADIAIGNIVGSNIFNLLFVVGISALITPVPFQSKFIFDTLVTIGATILLWLCCFKNKKLNRWAGILFLLCYAAYFTVIFLKP